MKSIVVRIFPEKIAKLIIVVGQSIKQAIRYGKRRIRYGKKQFTKIVPGVGTPFKMVLDPYHNGTVDEVIADTLVWENEVSNALVNNIVDNGVFLDIGGNIGYHSLLMATDKTHHGVEVHTFEPIVKLCEQIHKSITINSISNITLHRVGLGATLENKTMYVRGENIGGSSVMKFNELELTKVSSTQTISIVPLDDLLPTLKRVDLIKIDVEGFEFEVLRGGTKVLQKFHPVIVMEFSPVFYKIDYPEKSYELIDFLSSLGYSYYSLDATPINISLWLKENPDATQIDVICK